MFVVINKFMNIPGYAGLVESRHSSIGAAACRAGRNCAVMGAVMDCVVGEYASPCEVRNLTVEEERIAYLASF